MWWRRGFLAASCVGLVACSLWEESDFPQQAVAFSPPPEFRVWWDIVERCSLQRRRFDDVTWFQAPMIAIRDRFAFGVWSAALNRIALTTADEFNGGVVRHEMLHAILQRGGHPEVFFKGMCGDVVTCGRDCPAPEIPSDAEPIAPEDVVVDLDVFPKEPSLSRQGGRLSFVLSVRNPRSSNAFMDVRSIGMSHCPAGIILVSASDPNRWALRCTFLGFGGLPRLFFGNETRRIVLDVRIQQLDPGQGPFFAEDITVGAVLGDNVRRTVNLKIRP